MLGFALEAGDKFGVFSEEGVDDFDGNVAIERGLERFVHFSHTPAPQSGYNFKFANRLSYQIGGAALFTGRCLSLCHSGHTIPYFQVGWGDMPDKVVRRDNSELRNNSTLAKNYQSLSNGIRVTKE